MKSASRPAPVSGSRRCHTIELNCLPRRVESTKLPVGHVARRRARRRLKCALPSGVGKSPPSHRRAPPHWIASPVSRRCSMPAYAGTTRAISSRIAWPSSQPNAVGALRVGRAGRGRRRSRHSLRASPTCAARDLGAERDAPLGGGRRAAALLLVARRGRQQHDGLARVDEHLVRHHDVLVDAQRHARRARRATTSGAGSTSRKLPPLDHSTSSSPRARRLDHLGRGEARRRSATGEAPLLAERGRGSARDRRRRRETPWRSTPISAPPCTPEWPRIGISPAPAPPDVAARQPEVDDRVRRCRRRARAA